MQYSADALLKCSGAAMLKCSGAAMLKCSVEAALGCSAADVLQFSGVLRNVVPTTHEATLSQDWFLVSIFTVGSEIV